MGSQRVKGHTLGVGRQRCIGHHPTAKPAQDKLSRGICSNKCGGALSATISYPDCIAVGFFIDLSFMQNKLLFAQPKI
jgi:hypothetical protein